MAVCTAAYLALIAGFHRLGPGEPVSEFVTFYLAAALAWGTGAWLRSTRVAEAERRHRVAEETRTAERARIARELHDVVTHHVTAMVVQAEAARYLTAAPDRLDRTLTAVTDTGRRAITDLRHLLDLLQPDHGPEARTPPVGRLLTLVEQTRRAGQPVKFTEEGTPAPSTGSADLVAYRVVQEALTNALKHAHGDATRVDVRHGERQITVEVGTDGSGTPVTSSPAGAGGDWPGCGSGSTCWAATSARVRNRTAASSYGPAYRRGPPHDRADPGPGLRRPDADPHRAGDHHRRPARPGGGR
ncbi:hypothetical protein SHKM778_53870 [Streptomyces sp. KM77-8]|uniref:histidine kinase n=1 Tax=Streptomyces haneummycinicus TaxID=3074435 RepID=A0AAT9HN48_9ACTN